MSRKILNERKSVLFLLLLPASMKVVSSLLPDSYLFEFTLPLSEGLIYLLIPTIILIIFPRMYNSWVRFARWGLPVTVLLIIFTPRVIGGFGFITSQIVSYVDATRFWGIIFLVVSLLVISISAWRDKR